MAVWCRFLILACYLCAVLRADEQPKVVTGSALQKALASSVSWSADGVALQSQLASVRQQSGILVLRDRRVDPRSSITVETGFVARAAVLQQIAAAVPDCSAVVTDSYVLLGPANRVQRLPVLLKEVSEQENLWKKLPAGRLPRKAVSGLQPEWSAGAVPREILQRAAAECGIELENAELVPHDVWGAVQLPRQSFAELACLVLVQFDLQPVLAADSPRVRIEPIDGARVLELKYSVPLKQKEQLQSEWRQRHPEAGLRWSSSTVTLKADLDLHADFVGVQQRLSALGAGAGAAVPGDSLRTRQFQLQGERVTVGYLLQELRKNRIVIEVEGEDEPAVQRLLQGVVDLSVVREKQPGLKFFPALFGGQFRTVEVLDDRIRLKP
ncbi:MAG: hypothetical protein ACKPJD_15250 [Planctomycetaceae bacterium]